MDCQLCDYSALGEHPNSILSHLQDKHNICRNNGFLDYLKTHFILPTCACGCGREVVLKKKGLILNLFSWECPNKRRFINPKFPEFYLFAGKSSDETIAAIGDLQRRMAKKAATPAHIAHLSKINSGIANPASYVSIGKRTGQTVAEIKRELSIKSSGTANGFHGRKHTLETLRYLAKVRSQQAKTISKPELAVWGMLKAFGVSFDYQVAIEGYVADFVVCNTVIEVFGDYWHGPKMLASKRGTDQNKMAAFKQLGYNVIILHESEIFTNTDVVLNVLRELI